MVQASPQERPANAEAGMEPSVKGGFASGSVSVLIPVLARPHRVAPLLASLERSTLNERADGWSISPVFICSMGDEPEIAAVRAAGYAPFLLHDPGYCEYARKINLAVELTKTDWVLTGADDLEFHAGWLRAAINMHIQTGALVVGTNDKANPTVIAGRHATHSLVHRDYVKFGTIDEPGKLLHAGYDHNAVDVEFCETAQARGTWAFARHSVIAHLHPTFKRDVRRDATYIKGLRYGREDRMLLNSRRHLWRPGYVDRPAAGNGRVRGAKSVRAQPVPSPQRWPRR